MNRILLTSGHLAGKLAAALVFLLLIGPLLVVVGSSLSPAIYLEFPPSSLSLRWYQSLLENPEWRTVFGRTLLIAGISVPISLAFGVLSAVALHRGNFRRKEMVLALFMSPIMLAEVMIGTALLYYVSAIGLTNTITALVIAHVVVTLPFVIRLVLVSAQGLDSNVERAAVILGASPVRVFMTVTLPMMRPGLLAAGVFAAVLSIGEMALTVFLVGPETTTVPVMIYTKVVYGFDPTITAVASLFTLIAFPTMIALDRWVGLDKVF